MAPEELPDNYLKAGGEYLSALQKLGLDPNFLGWAYDDHGGEFVLLMTTVAYDDVGPLEIQKLLFTAYNRSATPKEISPFIVNLQSPRSRHMVEIMRELEGEFHVTGANPPTHDITLDNGAVLHRPLFSGRKKFVIGGFTVDTKWLLSRHYIHMSQGERKSLFEGFRRNVERLAA